MSERTTPVNPYKKFFDLSLDLLCMADSDGYFQLANKAFCSELGYPEEALFDTRFLDLVHPDDISSTRSELKKIADGIATTNFENRYRHADGRYLRLSWSARHDPETGCIYASARDLTANISYQKELERILGILNETGKIAKVGGWELDVATEELTWTDETFRILEVEKKGDQKPVLPEGLSLFTPECQPIIENAVNRAITYGEPYSLELEAQTAKGNVLWVYTNGKANYKDGKVISLSGTIQDIHARKVAEMNYENERQRAIRNAKLVSLGELAASMAHEINNPLGIITGNAELIKLNDELPRSVTSKADIIINACDRVSHIVKSLRKFSRTSYNEDFREAQLANIIREAVTLAGPRLKNERVSLETDLDESVTLNCIEIEIEQVLLHLINNAIDAMEDNTDRQINIQLTDKKDHIELRVIDSGVGIPPEKASDIFSPFQTSKSPGKGTGLGLAVVGSILKDHNASIELNKDSLRTCFVIRFPGGVQGENGL